MLYSNNNHPLVRVRADAETNTRVSPQPIVYTLTCLTSDKQWESACRGNGKGLFLSIRELLVGSDNTIKEFKNICGQFLVHSDVEWDLAYHCEEAVISNVRSQIPNAFQGLYIAPIMRKVDNMEMLATQIEGDWCKLTDNRMPVRILNGMRFTDDYTPGSGSGIPKAKLFDRNSELIGQVKLPKDVSNHASAGESGETAVASGGPEMDDEDEDREEREDAYNPYPRDESLEPIFNLSYASGIDNSKVYNSSKRPTKTTYFREDDGLTVKRNTRVNLHNTSFQSTWHPVEGERGGTDTVVPLQTYTESTYQFMQRITKERPFTMDNWGLHLYGLMNKNSALTFDLTITVYPIVPLDPNPDLLPFQNLMRLQENGMDAVDRVRN